MILFSLCYKCGGACKVETGRSYLTGKIVRYEVCQSCGLVTCRSRRKVLSDIVIGLCLVVPAALFLWQAVRFVIILLR